MPPLLTIAVPTYQRADLLRGLLDALVHELAQLGGQVEVLVGDNASTDETQKVLAVAGQALPLRTHRHAENLGAMGNLRWLCTNARTEYIWCFGDDDRPEPGAVRRVVDLLVERQPVWLHLPHRWVREEDGAVLGGSPCPAELRVFAGSGDLFRAHHHWLTFMAGSVLRTDELATAIREHPTENLYGPFIWYYHAGRGGPCVVPPEYLVAGSTAISWGDLRATVMTLHFAGLFDEAVGLDLTPHEFGRLLDDLYGSEELLELWRQVPADTFESVVRRFPTSRTLRWLLWTRAREERRDDWLATVAGAVEESGATVEALELVRQGEEIYLQGDAAGALPLFDAAVRLAPTLATGWTDLGVVRHALWLPDAVEAFDLALACAPNDVDALLNRARVVLEAGDGARARDDVDHVLNLEPANETALELARVLGLA